MNFFQSLHNKIQTGFRKSGLGTRQLRACFINYLLWQYWRILLFYSKQWYSYKLTNKKSFRSSKMQKLIRKFQLSKQLLFLLEYNNPISSESWKSHNSPIWWTLILSLNCLITVIRRSGENRRRLSVVFSYFLARVTWRKCRIFADILFLVYFGCHWNSPDWCGIPNQSLVYFWADNIKNTQKTTSCIAKESVILRL